MAKPEKASEIIKSLSDRFKSEKSPDFELIYHFEISGDNGGDFTVKIDSGNIDVSEGLHGNAKCVIKAKDKDYEDLELGRSNPQMAVMMGKVKVSNIGSMLKFIEMFEKLS